MRKTPAAGSPPPGRPPLTSTQRWVLTLSGVASCLVILDMLVVATSLTAIQHSLGSSQAGLEWTLNGYTLSFAVLMMTATALGERLGRRRVLIAGLVLFAAASATCALSPNLAALVTARVVQGVGAALIMPMALALLNAAFPPERRGWAIGVYGSVSGIAVALGPIVGGAVTQGLGWQWIFWINVPIALAATFLVRARIAETPRGQARPDLPGLVLVTVGALGLVWGLVRGGTAGWRSPEVIATLTGGAVTVAAFGWWQRRATAPMLPPRLFRSRAFSAGNLVVFWLAGSMTAMVFWIPQFEQVALHERPLPAGLGLLPWGVVVMLLASRAGALADRIGARTLCVIGLLMNAAGTTWIAVVANQHTSYPELVAPIVVTGVGIAMALPATTRAATSTTPGPDIGRAAGAFNTMRQLGGTFGVAITGAAFAATGDYARPSSFATGFSAANWAMTAMFAVGIAAALFLPGRSDHRATVPRPTAAATDRPAADPGSRLAADQDLTTSGSRGQ